MIVTPLLVPAAITSVFAGLLFATVLSTRNASHKTRLRTAGSRLEPLLLDGERAGWSQAPVHGTPLVICYRELAGDVLESVIHPKSILGEKVPARGVRPDTVNAYCEAQQGMRAFRYTGILWAADAQSGELIEDLYHYLGGAQPGGAPAPAYGKAASASPPKALKRHW